VLALQLSQTKVAARLSGAVTQLHERLGLPRSPFAQAQWETHLEALRCALHAEVLAAETVLGIGWELEEAIGSALGVAAAPVPA